MSELHLIITGNPVPASRPRIFKNGGRSYSKNYLAYRKNLDEQLSTSKKLSDSSKKPISIIIDFYMPIPSSWSKKKQLEHEFKYHTSKPDLDNLEKAILDGLVRNGNIPEDSYISIKYSRKIYSFEPRTEINIEQLQGS